VDCYHSPLSYKPLKTCSASCTSCGRLDATCSGEVDPAGSPSSTKNVWTGTAVPWGGAPAYTISQSANGNGSNLTGRLLCGVKAGS
jgi:hypothetical protein